MADIKIYGRLVSGTASKELAKADEIIIEAIDGVDATTVQDALEEIASSSGGYEPPVGGIPKTDLASDVQTSLGKADTALQSYTETDPTVSSWAKAPTKPTYTAQEVGALPNTTTIPTKVSDLTNDSGFVTASSIPDTSTLATKTEVQQGLAGKQDTLTFDNTPTANSNNVVKSGGIFTALQTLLSNITIGQNGNWYVGSTDTGVKAQGPKGNSVVDGDTFDIVNNLYDGGEEDALSAEMGVVLKTNILASVAKVNELIDALAGIAYVGNPVSKLTGLNWDSTVAHINLASGSSQYLELTGALTGTTYSGTLSVKSAYATTKGIPFAGDVTAMMGGTSKAITYNESTGAITISNVTSDVEITALAADLEGGIRFKNGLYFSGDNDDSTTADANWCISDFITANGTLKLIIDAGENAASHFACYYNSSKQYIGHNSLNNRYNVRQFTASGDYTNGIAYIRICYPIAKRNKRFIYDFTNDAYLFKASGYDGRYENLIWGSSYYCGPASDPEGQHIDDTANNFVYCRMDNYVNSSPGWKALEYDFGFVNAGNYNTHTRRCIECKTGASATVARLMAWDSTDGQMPASFSSNNVYVMTRGTFKIENLDDCYIYDVTNDKYIFRGLNEPTAQADS